MGFRRNFGYVLCSLGIVFSFLILPVTYGLSLIGIIVMVILIWQLRKRGRVADSKSIREKELENTQSDLEKDEKRLAELEREKQAIEARLRDKIQKPPNNEEDLTNAELRRAQEDSANDEKRLADIEKEKQNKELAELEREKEKQKITQEKTRQYYVVRRGMSTGKIILIIFLIIVISVIIVVAYSNYSYNTTQKYLDAGCEPLTANQYGQPSTFKCPKGTIIK
jgi:Membrane-bound metallopeptidase